MKIQNEELKEMMFEEIYKSCFKKEFSTHEKSEYDICVLEKILLQNAFDKNQSR